MLATTSIQVPPPLAPLARAWESPDTNPVRLAGFIAALVAAADFLLLGHRIGASVSIFGVILIAALALVRPGVKWDSTHFAGLVLVSGALAQAAVSLNFFNVVAIGLLFAAAMTDQGAKACRARPAVWPLAFVAALGGLGRWPKFLDLMSKADLPSVLSSKVGGRFRANLFGIFIPAVVVSIPFVLLLRSGNALLGAHLDSLSVVLRIWARNLHFPNVGRIMFWGFTATCSLVFLYPAINLRAASLCSVKWASFAPGADERVDRWRSLLILFILNGLFFWANGIDAVFLWLNAKLPANVTYSAFVHEGTVSLVATTLLSAAVLTVMFQQDTKVAGGAWVKGSAMLCIAQNLFMITSVALRLKLYVEAYDLSVLRVHVCTFLAIVSIGYLLLAWKIVLGRSLNWLVLANGAAVFGVFYVVQFINVDGLVAEYNTDRWLGDRKRNLDIGYLVELGAPALPELVRIEREGRGTREATTAACEFEKARAEWKLRKHDWRSWQWRDDGTRNRVFSSAGPPDMPSP